ncbi:MAG: RICIN domain-containing protein [Bacteroidota bacterium]
MLRFFYLKRVILCSIFFLCLLSSGPAWATTYYLAANGNDNADGKSASTAWRTIDKVNTIDFAPGDVLLLEGGQTFVGGIKLNKADGGTLGQPLKIASYGTGRAILSLGTATAGIYCEDVSYLEIANLRIIGPGKTAATKTRGIDFWSWHQTTWNENVRINGVEITGMSGQGNGINFAAWESVGWRDVRMTNCSVHDGDYGAAITTVNGPSLEAKHDNFYIGHCHVYNEKPITYEERNGPKMGNGILLLNADHSLIEYCVAHDGVNAGSYGIWGYNLDNSVIQYCEVYGYRNHGLGSDGGGFDIDGCCENLTIQYCYAHDNEGAGYLIWPTSSVGDASLQGFGNNTVRYNLSEDNGKVYGGVTYGGGTYTTGPTYVYNNTIRVGSNPAAGSGLTLWNGNDTNQKIYFYNNTVVDQYNRGVVSDYSGGDGVFQGNLYYNRAGELIFMGSYPSGSYYYMANANGQAAFQAWQDATGQEKYNGANVGIVADPLNKDNVRGITVGFDRIDQMPSLMQGYTLQANSPAINKGINLKTAFNIDPGPRDFYRNASVSGPRPDLGAYEYPTIGEGTQSPYAGVIPIPGIIQTENFDKGGEGVAYHDNEASNQGSVYRQEGVDIEACAEGGYNVGWTNTGEWLEYTVNVATTGSYTLEVRVASTGTGSLHVDMDGANVTGATAIPNTSGSQAWQTVNKTVTLTAGQHIMRVTIDAGNCNLNKLTFTTNGGGIVSGQIYRLVARHSGKVLDVSTCNVADGANVQQWSWIGGGCQRWKVEATNNGYYRLTAQHSNKVLEVSAGGTGNGSNVQQWGWTGTNWQQWKIEPTDNGYYKLTARHSGKVLDVSGVSTADGANVHQWGYLGGNNQQWKLEVVGAARIGVEAHSLVLTPNPASEFVNLTWNDPSQQAVEIALVNQLGEVVYTQSLQNDNQWHLNTTRFKAGLYLVKVTSKQGVASERLLITH